MSDETDPQNLEAERTILGAVLVDGRALMLVSAIITADDFVRPLHRDIFRAMLKLSDQGVEIDAVTVKNALKSSTEAVGAYLGKILDGIPRNLNVEHWARIVREKSIMRALKNAGHGIVAAAVDSETSADAIGYAMGELMRVSERAQGEESFADPAIAAKSAMALLDKLVNAKQGVIGLRTGLDEYDEMTGGMQPEQLIVIAGRPGMGKTAFAVTVADNLAAAGKIVGFLSLEMSRDELTLRRLSKRSGVSHQTLRYKPELYSKVGAAFPSVSTDPFFVDATPALTVAQIRAGAKRLAAEKGGLSLLVVDYIQLVRGERSENRQQEVAGVARALKNLAKELKVPVLALSQLNRELERAKDHRPQLADLRESGEIEQAADIVGFLYRACVYDSTAAQEDAEIIVRKQRNGPPFTANVKYLRELTKFQNREA